MRRYQPARCAAGRETAPVERLPSGDNPSEDGRDLEEARHTDLADARLRAEAATDALVAFLAEAVAEVEHKCPLWYADVESRREQAEAKVPSAR